MSVFYIVLVVFSLNFAYKTLLYTRERSCRLSPKICINLALAAFTVQTTLAKAIR